MRHSLFAITALAVLVFTLVAGQSYIAMDRKFVVVREMGYGLAVVRDRDGRIYFRLQNDAACGGYKYFYDDEVLYSRHDGTDEPGTFLLTRILDVNSLQVVKVYKDQPLIRLQDKAYAYRIVRMHCCFNLFADKKL